MDENASKGLHLGTTVMATMALIGIAITVVVLAISIIRKGSSQASEMTNDLADQKYTQYDNTIVNGDTILSLIKQYENSDISIVVDVSGTEVKFVRDSSGASEDGAATLGDKIDHSTETTNLKNAKDKTNDAYIAPAKQFTCTICRNSSTDAITAMYFKSIE